MTNANLSRKIISYVLVFALGGVVALALFGGGGLPGLRAPLAGAASGPRGFLPKNATVRSSSVSYLEQYYLHDHLSTTAQMRARGATAAGAHPAARAPLFTAPGGALSFNSDTSAIPQATESYAIDPSTTGSQTGMIGVGGFTDLREFYLANNTGSGYAVSKNVTCTAGTCAQLLKDGWLPATADPACASATDGSQLMPTGEPSVAASSGGTIYYASMAAPVPFTGISPDCANMNNDSGLIIATSTASLENAAAPCNDALSSNSCWTSTVVEEPVAGCATNVEPCGFDSQETIVVDPVSGTLTMAWDYEDFVTGGEFIQTTTCTPALSCTAPVTVSTPEAGCPANPAIAVNPNAGTGGFAGCETYNPRLAIWHNPVSHVNNVLLTYEGVVSASPFNTNLHLADLTTHTDTTFLSLTQYQAATGLSADGFPIDPNLTVAADSDNVTTPHIYVAWEQCKSQAAAYYFNANFPSGACSQSSVHVWNFTSPTGAGTGIPVLGGFNQFFPSIAVDETSGHVALAYYSTQGDAAALSLIRPYAATSSGSINSATPTAFSANTYQAVLTGNYRYTADPFFGLGFFGAPGIGGVSAIGDYLQVAVANGAIFIHFNATFEQKSGPASIGTTLVNQSDNYLCYIQPTTANTANGACSSS